MAINRKYIKSKFIINPPTTSDNIKDKYPKP